MLTLSFVSRDPERTSAALSSPVIEGDFSPCQGTDSPAPMLTHFFGAGIVVRVD